MATFITTIKFTEQGLGKIRETTKRAAAFKTAAKKMGVKIENVYWTLGPFDGVLIFDAPNEQTATATMLQLATQGNVQTATSRAFLSAEMDKVLGMLPK